jgi:cytoskeletal protein CcmA (bactofilin family)
VVALREAEAEGGGEAGDDATGEAGAPPGGGFAVGFGIALAAVALALAGLDRVAARGMASDVGWLSPLRLSGAYEMLFDVVFWVRNRAPGLLELVAALVAMASVAALAALGASSLARRIRPRLGVALAFGIGSALAEPGSAFETRAGDTVVVPADEQIAGSLAVSGEEVRIEGTVDGDLFAAGDKVTIAGRVEGNVFTWARDLEVSGRVAGSLHAGSERARIDGAIAGSSYTFTESFALGAQGRVGLDAFGFGRSAAIEGEVGRDLHLAADEIVIRGRVGRDLHAPRAGRVVLEEGARVGRNLTVRVARESDLEVAPGATIGGAREVGPAVHGDVESIWQPRPWLWTVLRASAALVFGVALYALLPGLFHARVPTASRFLRLLGTGLLTLVAVPIALTLIALTLVGLPLALLGVFAYLTALYLGHVLAAAELGRALLRRRSVDLPGLASFARTLLVGLVAIALAGRLPAIGAAVHVVVLLFGLGLVADRVRSLAAGPRAPRPA